MLLDVSTPQFPNTFTMVDDEDFERFSCVKWGVVKRRKRWYAMRNTQATGAVSLHRAVINAPIGMVVDHINGDGLDNRKQNLRVCTSKENCRNSPPISKTGFKGVSVRVRGGKTYYQARITVDYKEIYLGTYPTARDAAIAYDEAAQKHFGEFARLNFPKAYARMVLESK